MTTPADVSAMMDAGDLRGAWQSVKAVVKARQVTPDSGDWQPVLAQMHRNWKAIKAYAGPDADVPKAVGRYLFSLTEALPAPDDPPLTFTRVRPGLYSAVVGGVDFTIQRGRAPVFPADIGLLPEGKPRWRLRSRRWCLTPDVDAVLARNLP